MSDATNFFGRFVLLLIVFWQHGADGGHAFVKDRLRNVPRLLSAAKVLRVCRRRIELDSALSDEVPAVLQVLCWAGQLEVVDVDGLAYRVAIRIPSQG